MVGAVRRQELGCCASLLPLDMATQDIVTSSTARLTTPSASPAARDAAAARDATRPCTSAGDKEVDLAYTAPWRLAPITLRSRERPGFRSTTVFVATDELDRAVRPLRDAGYTLRFVDDLAQPPLLAALTAFPQPVWRTCSRYWNRSASTRSAGFVGSLPSTLSGHIVNAPREAVPTRGATACVTTPS